MPSSPPLGISCALSLGFVSLCLSYKPPFISVINSIFFHMIVFAFICFSNIQKPCRHVNTTAPMAFKKYKYKVFYLIQCIFSTILRDYFMIILPCPLGSAYSFPTFPPRFSLMYAESTSTSTATSSCIMGLPTNMLIPSPPDFNV